MARYIDADRLLKEIEDSPDKPEINDGAEETEWIMKCINSAPAADVRPERYGGWLYSEDGIWECSECGAGSRSPTNPFCWKCGAKMDGDKINGQKDT